MSIVRKIKIINKQFERKNFYCSTCNYPLISGEDFETGSGYDCCYDCYLQFIEGNKEERKRGQRPSKTVLRDYISLKNKLNSKEIK
jgi:hypothetical protein